MKSGGKTNRTYCLVPLAAAARRLQGVTNAKNPAQAKLGRGRFSVSSSLPVECSRAVVLGYGALGGVG